MGEISAKTCLDIFVLNNAVEFFRPAAPPLSEKALRRREYLFFLTLFS